MACKAEVLAPESTRAFIAGIPSSGKEHHSSEPNIILLGMRNVETLEEYDLRRYRTNVKT